MKRFEFDFDADLELLLNFILMVGQRMYIYWNSKASFNTFSVSKIILKRLLRSKMMIFLFIMLDTFPDYATYIPKSNYYIFPFTDECWIQTNRIQTNQSIPRCDEKKKENISKRFRLVKVYTWRYGCAIITLNKV